MRNVCVAVFAVALACAGSIGCASKGFVRESVGAANDKIESLIDSLEETQERNHRNEQRIEQVDSKLGTIEKSAHDTLGVASRAAGAAKAADAKLTALEKASNRFLYNVVLTADEANFRFGSADLPEEARAKIDGLIADATRDARNIFIEIEGHTDDVGPHAVNANVGLARAQAVLRYLHDRYEIPLHKMSVISFGEDRPVASNATLDGRARNRRVVIRIRA